MVISVLGVGLLYRLITQSTTSEDEKRKFEDQNMIEMRRMNEHEHVEIAGTILLPQGC